jgi:hypothetical protein
VTHEARQQAERDLAEIIAREVVATWTDQTLNALEVARRVMAAGYHAGPRIPEPDTPEEAALRLAHRRAEADLTWALTVWACERWRDEVSNRPMGNIHRRTLDDTWRQVLRHLGADDVALLGPAHDDIAALHGESRNDG